VSVGMFVNISPSNVIRENWHVVGRVIEIGGIPEKRSSMMALLNNDVLVNQFTALGAPLFVRVALLPDPKSTSGLKWTSGLGLTCVSVVAHRPRRYCCPRTAPDHIGISDTEAMAGSLLVSMKWNRDRNVRTPTILQIDRLESARCALLCFLAIGVVGSP